MRQSEHKVTVPYLDYKELIDSRARCDKIISDIRRCFDTSLHDIDAQEPIHLRTDIVVSVLRKYLANKYKDSVIL